MQERRSRSLAVWFLLPLSSALYFFMRAGADNDLWGHLLFGREILRLGHAPSMDYFSYTAAGTPWFNHEWLSQLLLYAVFAYLGQAALIALKCAIGCATVGVLTRHPAVRALPPAPRALLTVLLIAALARGFSFRPQIFTYAFCALEIAICERNRLSGSRSIWLLVPLFAFWSDMHGGFLAGLALLALYSADLALARSAGIKQAAAVLALSALATLANPYGISLYSYILGELGRPHPITEWQPPALLAPEHLPFVLLLALLVVCLACARKTEPRWLIAAAAGTALLALRHQRHIPLFAIIAFVPLTANCAALLAGRLGEAGRLLSAPARLAVTCAAGCLIPLQIGMLGSALAESGFRITYESGDYPVNAVRAMAGAGCKGNLAVPLEWGEYVLWHLSPAVRVSIDGRFATIFSDEISEANFRLYREGFDSVILDRFATDAVLLPADSPCLLCARPGWRIVFEDAVTRVLQREKAGFCAKDPDRGAVPNPPLMIFP